MRKILDWILRLIPAEYKWAIAAKKITYTVAKLAVSGVMYGTVGKHVGSHLSPDQLAQIQASVGVATAAALEGIHDFLKLKFPDSPLL